MSQLSPGWSGCNIFPDWRFQTRIIELSSTNNPMKSKDEGFFRLTLIHRYISPCTLTQMLNQCSSIFITKLVSCPSIRPKLIVPLVDRILKQRLLYIFCLFASHTYVVKRPEVKHIYFLFLSFKLLVS